MTWNHVKLGGWGGERWSSDRIYHQLRFIVLSASRLSLFIEYCENIRKNVSWGFFIGRWQHCVTLTLPRDILLIESNSAWIHIHSLNFSDTYERHICSPPHINAWVRWGSCPYPPLAGTLESRPCTSPRQYNRVRPCWQRCGWASPKVVSMGELPPLFICLEVAWVGQRSSFLTVRQCRWESCSYPSSACSTLESGP